MAEERQVVHIAKSQDVPLVEVGTRTAQAEIIRISQSRRDSGSSVRRVIHRVTIGIGNAQGKRSDGTARREL